MNQRIRRASRKGSTFATGGHVVHHARGAEPEVRVPAEKQPEPKQPGLAKASPFFKKLSEITKANKNEKEIIEENTISDEEE
jgi:hypothetical protein